MLSRFIIGITRLWSKGCLGKAIVVLSCLLVLMMCRSIFGKDNHADITMTPTPIHIAPTVIVTATEVPTTAPTAAKTKSPTKVAATDTTLPTEEPSVTSEPTEVLTIAPMNTPKPKPTVALIIQPTTAPKPTTAPARVNYDRNGDGKVTCKDFDTQAQAKKALEAGHKNLDKDGDGIPCEDLPPG